MTADNVTRIRRSMRVEGVDPSLPDALEWADRNIDIDAITYLDVISAYLAGVRSVRDVRGEEATDAT